MKAFIMAVALAALAQGSFAQTTLLISGSRSREGATDYFLIRPEATNGVDVIFTKGGKVTDYRSMLPPTLGVVTSDWKFLFSTRTDLAGTPPLVNERQHEADDTSPPFVKSYSILEETGTYWTLRPANSNEVLAIDAVIYDCTKNGKVGDLQPGTRIYWNGNGVENFSDANRTWLLHLMGEQTTNDFAAVTYFDGAPFQSVRFGKFSAPSTVKQTPTPVKEEKPAPQPKPQKAASTKAKRK